MWYSGTINEEITNNAAVKLFPKGFFGCEISYTYLSGKSMSLNIWYINLI